MNNNLLPKVVAMELTYKCNHQCIFCSCPWEEKNNHLKEAELSTTQIFKNIDIIKEHGVSHITLTGGEPFLRDDLFDIIEYIKSSNLSVSVISNGLKIDNKALKLLKKYDVQLSISVPGIKTFKEHTGIDNLDNVLNIFKEAKSLGIITTANITVTKLNLDELYENIAYPLINGAEHILLNRFLPGGRGMDNKRFLLSISDINQMLQTAEEVLSKCNKYGHVGTEMPYCIIKDYEKYKHISIGTKCSAVKEFFVIDPSGYIKVCNHSPIRLCKVKDVLTLKKNKYWLAFIKSAYIPQMCKSCHNLDICDGGCREAANVNYGSISADDPCFH